MLGAGAATDFVVGKWEYVQRRFENYSRNFSHLDSLSLYLSFFQLILRDCGMIVAEQYS